MKRILVVSPNFPYPANYGGGVDIWRRICSLVESGHTVDLLATVKEYPNIDDLKHVKAIVNEVFFVIRENKLTDLLSLFPLQVISRKKLKYIKLEQKYDITILEGDYVGLILSNRSLSSTHLILRSHNNEKKYFMELASSSGLKLNSVYYLSESLKFSFFVNAFLLKKVKNTLFISSSEFEFFSRGNKSNHNAIFLPTPVNKQNFKSKELKGNTVLFVGSLFMPNNQEAILWYLKHIHSAFLSIPNYKFLVAGSTKGHDVSAFIEKLNIYSALELHQDVPDLKYIYDDGAVFVNPMRRGAGVKIKSINAIIEGIPLISTRVGAEGTGLKNNEHYLEANTPKEFISSLMELLSSVQQRQKLAKAAQEFLIKNNHDDLLKNFINDLDKGF